MSAGGSVRVVVTALCSNLAVACFKLGAAIITGSGAMMSAAIHTFVDTANQVLMLIGMKRSQIPASARFPLGHHRELSFFAVVVAGVLFSGGGVMAVMNAIHHIMHPDTPEVIKIFGHETQEWLVNTVVLVVGGILEAPSLLSALKEFRLGNPGVSFYKAFRKTTDVMTLVVLVEDLSAVTSLCITLISVILTAITGLRWIDGLASLLVGLLLMVSSALLLRECYAINTGESSDPELVKGIIDHVVLIPEIEHVNTVIVEFRGIHHAMVILSLDCVNSLPTGESEKLTTRIEQELRAKWNVIHWVVIEYQSRKDSDALAKKFEHELVQADLFEKE